MYSDNSIHIGVLNLTPHERPFFSSTKGEMNQTSLRTDTRSFGHDYFEEPHPAIAQNFLWPVPVFERSRADQSVVVDGELTLSPGDVLEACGTDFEEYLLVVSILPTPTTTNPRTVSRGSDLILLYSSNEMDYRVFDTSHFSAMPPRGDDIAFLSHPATGTVFAVHEDAGPTIAFDGDLATTSVAGVCPRTGSDGPTDNLLHSYRHTRTYREISPKHGRAHDVEPLDSFLSEVTVDTAYETLANIPTNSIHSWVTSPPYFSLRDYEEPDQLGQEPTVNQYLENLLSVVNQLMRVTRDDGTGWLVVDDSYDDGALAGIPDRLVGELRTEGYNVIHNGPWVKTSMKPDPAPRRFAHAHERVIGIAANDDYYFHRRAVDDQRDVFETPTGGSSANHDAVYPVELPEHIIAVATPEAVCPDCGAPHQTTYEVTDIRNLPTDRAQCRRALELASEHGLSEEHLWACRAVGLGDTGLSARTQSGTGRNSESVEALFEEAREALGSYTREFTMAKKSPIATEPTCECASEDDPVPGIVLDPFMGSGTTGTAAVLSDRRWAGVELNEEYAVDAESRISESRREAPHVPDEDQGTLLDF